MGQNQSVYSAYHNSETVVKSSSSGGVFTALSDYILKNNGIVVGGRYNYVAHRLEHMVSSTPEERDELRGSKYIQSSISREIYCRIEHCLKNNQAVLFVGTPCQVNAINRYLEVKKISKASFYGIDLLCHGVGSTGLWNAFVDQLQKSRRMKISQITFKGKRKGWLHPTCLASDGRKETSIQGYSWLYFSDSIMRPSCHSCKYASAKRVGDITIGDYWKAKEKTPNAFNVMGTSVIIVNTSKGSELFDAVKESLIYQRSTMEDCMQPNLEKPTKTGKYRDRVMTDYQKCGKKLFFAKWQTILFIDKVLSKIKR